MIAIIEPVCCECSNGVGSSSSSSSGASSVMARRGVAGDAPTQPARRGGPPERNVSASAAAHSDRQAPGGSGDSGAGADPPRTSEQGSAAAQGSAALGLGLGSVVGAGRTRPQFTVVNAQVLCTHDALSSQAEPRYCWRSSAQGTPGKALSSMARISR